MSPPERRKTTTIQRVSLALNVSQLAAVASLSFWVGQQAQEIKQLRTEQEQSTAADVRTQQVISTAVARIDVIENRGDLMQTLVRDLKADLNERLRRIEDKLDSRNRR